MIEPKKHHYVPQCYLNEYSKDKNVYSLNLPILFERKKIHVTLKNSNQICYLKDFYLLENLDYYDLDKYDKYFIELKAFNKLEKNYRQIIRNIFDKNLLNSLETITLSDFIVNLKIRNPYFLKNTESNKHKNVSNAMQSTFLKATENSKFKNIPREIILSYIDEFGFDLLNNRNYIKNTQLKQIIDKTNPLSTSIVKFRESIIDCKWFLLSSSKCEVSFFTSDNPGVSVSSKGILENTKFKGGFEYYFPINSQFCLYFTDKYNDDYFKSGLKVDKKIEIIEIEKNKINYINSLFIKFHNKYLFSNEESDLFAFAKNSIQYL